MIIIVPDIVIIAIQIICAAVSVTLGISLIAYAVTALLRGINDMGESALEILGACLLMGGWISWGLIL
jgi:hypothetical protein